MTRTQGASDENSPNSKDCCRLKRALLHALRDRTNLNTFFKINIFVDSLVSHHVKLPSIPRCAKIPRTFTGVVMRSAPLFRDYFYFPGFSCFWEKAQCNNLGGLGIVWTGFGLLYTSFPFCAIWEVFIARC